MVVAAATGRMSADGRKRATQCGGNDSVHQLCSNVHPTLNLAQPGHQLFDVGEELALIGNGGSRD